MIPYLTKGQRLTAWLGLKILKLFKVPLDEAEANGMKPGTVQLMRDYLMVRECEKGGAE